MNPFFFSKLKSLQLNNLVIVRNCRSVYAKEMLTELAGDYNYFNMAQLNLRVLAKQDAVAFVSSLKLPVFLDNLQYTPKILSELAKLPAGSVLASCTQSFTLEQLAQDLANIRFVDLPRVEDKVQSFVPTFRQRTRTINWQKIYQPQQQKVYGEYLREVLEADIMELTQVRDWLKFYHFIEAVAMLAGEKVNYVKLAKLAEITLPTAKSWLKFLLGTGMVYLLQSVPSAKINTPKLYFRDVGLAYCLLGLQDAPKVESAQSRKLWQNYIVNCVREKHFNEGIFTPFYFSYRNKKKIIFILRWDSAFNLKARRTKVNKK